MEYVHLVRISVMENLNNYNCMLISLIISHNICFSVQFCGHHHPDIHALCRMSQRVLLLILLNDNQRMPYHSISYLVAYEQ